MVQARSTTTHRPEIIQFDQHDPLVPLCALTDVKREPALLHTLSHAGMHHQFLKNLHSPPPDTLCGRPLLFFFFSSMHPKQSAESVLFSYSPTGVP